jgi:ABC-type thiamine transport system substrate-binding protein
MKLINWSSLFVLVFLWAHGLARASDQVTIEAARKEGSLMIYNSMTPSQMQLIINAFHAKYPFIEIKVYRAVGERLLTKILTEAQAGQHDFDIVQSGDTQAYFLKKKNLLTRYVSPEMKYLPKIFVDPEGYWAAMYSMPKIIGYNTRMIRQTDVPRTDEELLNPKWRGKIATDNTKPEPFFWIMERMGREKGIAYLKKLAAQELRFYAGLISSYQFARRRRVSPRLIHVSPQHRRGEEQGCAGGMGGTRPSVYEIPAGFGSRQSAASQCREALCRFWSVARRAKTDCRHGTSAGSPRRANEYCRA